MGMEGPQVPSQDEGTKVEQPIVETDNSMASEKAKALEVLENEEGTLSELKKQEDQLRLELLNAEMARDTVHLNNESTADMPEKDRSAMWERQVKIKQVEVDAIIKKLDELNNNEIIPQQHRIQDAKDAIYSIEHPIG